MRNDFLKLFYLTGNLDYYLAYKLSKEEQIDKKD